MAQSGMPQSGMGQSGMAQSGRAQSGRAHGFGRVVRWDAHEGHGAVVVEGTAAEIEVDASAVDAPGGRVLEVGELVEVEYAHPAPGEPGLRALRACPTDVAEG
jgi:hypothetical protein